MLLSPVKSGAVDREVKQFLKWFWKGSAGRSSWPEKVVSIMSTHNCVDQSFSVRVLRNVSDLPVTRAQMFRAISKGKKLTQENGAFPQLYM